MKANTESEFLFNTVKGNESTLINLLWNISDKTDFSYIFLHFLLILSKSQKIYTQKCQNLRVKGFGYRNLLIMRYVLPRQHAWPCLLILKLQPRSRDCLP